MEVSGHALHRLWAPALVFCAALFACAPRALAAPEPPDCEETADAVFEVARADRVWMARVVDVRTRKTIGGLIVTRSGVFTLRTTTPLKGAPPSTVKGRWTFSLFDDGGFAGAQPVKDELYFLADWPGSETLVPARCVIDLAEAEAASRLASPDPSGAALVVAARAERLAGRLRRARGMVYRGEDQIRIAMIAYEHKHGRVTNPMRLDRIESLLERGEIDSARHQTGGCSDFRMAGLLAANADLTGPRADRLRADLAQAITRQACPPPNPAR